MDNTTAPDWVKILKIIQKPKITQNDLLKISTILENNSFQQDIIGYLFQMSLCRGDSKEILNLLLPKIEDISNGFIQTGFITICTNNDIDAINYLLENGFIIEDWNYQMLINMGNQIKPDTIKPINDFIRRRKIEKIRNK